MARPRAFLLLTLVAAQLLVGPAGAAATEEEYHVKWRVEQAQFPYEGRLDEGATRTFRFRVEQSNVRELQFRLDWAEGEDSMRVSGPDRFSLAVAAPGGALVGGGPARGDSGRLVVTARDLNEVPRSGSVWASSMAEARGLAAEREGHEGVGEWSVEVTLESAGNPQGVRSDRGNPYALLVLMTYYEGSVLRVVSLEEATGAREGWAGAWEAAPGPWRWALVALAGAAAGLGGLLVVDARGRRRGRG